MALSQCYNCKEGLRRTRFNGSLSMKFCTCKKTTMKKKITKILNFFLSYEVHIRFFFINVNTLCYNNDENCDLFKL